MYKKWLELYGKIKDDMILNIKNIYTCPNCSSTKIKYQFTLYTTAMGTFDVWCENCNKGIHISRIAIEENIPALNYKNINSENVIIPSFEMINPDFT